MTLFLNQIFFIIENIKKYLMFRCSCVNTRAVEHYVIFQKIYLDARYAFPLCGTKWSLY